MFSKTTVLKSVKLDMYIPCTKGFTRMLVLMYPFPFKGDNYHSMKLWNRLHSILMYICSSDFSEILDWDYYEYGVTSQPFG